jgi:hypothetical protein
MSHCSGRLLLRECVLNNPLPSTGHEADHIREHFLQYLFYCCVCVFRTLPRNGSISELTSTFRWYIYIYVYAWSCWSFGALRWWIGCKTHSNRDLKLSFEIRLCGLNCHSPPCIVRRARMRSHLRPHEPEDYPCQSLPCTVFTLPVRLRSGSGMGSSINDIDKSVERWPYSDIPF